MSKHFNSFACALGTLAALGAGSPATAQTSDVPVEQADAPDAGGNIIVTAQKREERLRDVPATLLVASSEELANAGVRRPTDLSTAFPGLTFSNATASAQPAIRGVSTAAAGSSVENPVAIYIDGIYSPGQTSNNNFDFAFVENINLLKGPQGTVFGRNVVGGALLITTRGPDLGAFEGDASFTLSNFGGGSSKSSFNNEQRLFLSVPIVSDRLAASLAVSRSANQGYLTDLTPGSDGRWGRSRAYNVQGKLLWEPNDAISILFNARYVNLDQELGSTTGSGVSAGKDFPDAVVATLPWQTAHDYPAATSQETQSYSLKAEFDTDIGTFTSLTGYQKTTSPTLTDGDGAYSPLCTAAFRCVNLDFDFALPEVITQEIVYSSRKFGAVSFVGGVYAYSKKATTNVLLNDTVLFTDSELLSRSFAGFGELTFDISDRLSAIAGVRYTFDADQQRGRNFSTAFPYSPWNRNDWDAITKRFSLRYRATDEINLYATYSQGYQAGALTTSNFNTPTGALIAPLAGVRPQFLDAWEAGVKFNQPGVSFNLSGFYYKYEDILVQRFSGTNLEFTNAASAELYGIDTDWGIRLVDGLDFKGGISWLPRSNYVSFPDAPIYIATGNVAVPATVDLSGSRLIRSPKLTMSVGLDYNRIALGGLLNANANFYHSSSYSTQLGNENDQQGYETINASISFSPGEGPLKLTLFGRNLTNAAYITGTTASASAYRDYYAPPREVGLTVAYSF